MPWDLLLSYGNYKIVAILGGKLKLHMHRVHYSIVWCIFHPKRRAIIEFDLPYTAFVVVINVKLHLIHYLPAEVGGLQYAYFVLDIGFIAKKRRKIHTIGL